MTMQFHEIRRQQFLGKESYQLELQHCSDGIRNIEAIIAKAIHDEDLDYATNRASFQALLGFQRLLLNYTAGMSIEPLRDELEAVIVAYERYAALLWHYSQDRNEVVFKFYSIDDYCQLLQLIGLAFLLHRRDLIPRIAALQDGENGTSNGGADTLYEEFMAFGIGPETRFETDHLCQVRPYENLFYALTEQGLPAQLKELGLFLKRWYKDLAGTGWHDSHIEQAGYYGYWSFEAGAAVLLLGIEDDSSLHKYLYYPKHLVAWAKENAGRFPDGGMTATTSKRPNVAAGAPCPESGWWFTPAKANSRQYFKQGASMLSVGGDYGLTFWQ